MRIFSTKKTSAAMEAFKNNWFILSYAFKTVPLYVLGVCLLPASHRVLMFFEFHYMSKYIIDCLQFKRPIIYPVIYILTVFVAVTLWLLVANLFNILYKKKGQAKLYKKLQLDIYEKAAKMDLDCYDNPEFYTDFVWAMSEANKRADAVLETVAGFGQGIALILTSGLFMLIFDKIGLLFVAISFTFTFVFNIKINKLRLKLNEEMRPVQRRRDYINRVFYLNDFSKEIRLNGIKEKLYEDFDESNESLEQKIKDKTGRITVYSFLSDYISGSFILDGLYIIYLMFRLIVLTQLTYGTALALLQTSWGVKDGLGRFAKIIPEFQEHSLYIEKIKKFMDYRSKVVNNENPFRTPQSLSKLELKNVSFSYNEKGKQILKNISLTINPNEKIAIVGYNGAGKTTLTKLLMRLYDVTDGEILYDGKDIRHYDLESYRDLYGTVFQDYQLFAATVLENITMDNSNNDGDIVNESENINNALEQSGFKEKLNTLINGFKTSLTREFDDNGTNLSGGEAQKLAIARVLYKNCKIIILDEPSSALDPISEYNLNETISKVAKDKTVIFISHRLSTTRMADRIYMLENGQIIEAGSHDELMALNGKYAYMFNLQAEKYRIEEYMSSEFESQIS